MNRTIPSALFALLCILVLSGCAGQTTFKRTGNITVLPTEPGPMIVNGEQMASRQQLADYQAGLSSTAPVIAAPKAVAAVNGPQISDRQQLADYQASLPFYSGKTPASVTTVQQIANRQQLADYQANLR